MTDWPFHTLSPLSYEQLVVDPPWHFRHRSKRGEGKSAASHYSLMSLPEIKDLPVSHLARGDCTLYLWSTAPMQPQALEVMKAWGFRYKTELIWRKVTKNGKVRMGTGYWARSMHEVVLIGTIGSPIPNKAFPSVFDGVAREHSRKPDEFYELVEKHHPVIKKADLFSRQTRQGWDAWGLEATKFDEAA